MAAGIAPEIPFGRDPANQAARPSGYQQMPARWHPHSDDLTAASGPRPHQAQRPADRTGNPHRGSGGPPWGSA